MQLAKDEWKFKRRGIEEQFCQFVHALSISFFFLAIAISHREKRDEEVSDTCQKDQDSKSCRGEWWTTGGRAPYPPLSSRCISVINNKQWPVGRARSISYINRLASTVRGPWRYAAGPRVVNHPWPRMRLYSPTPLPLWEKEGRTR